MVESRVIKEGNALKPHEHYLLGVHMIMRKYGGYKLDDVLNLYITQFYALIKLISYEIHQENEAHKKANRKHGKKR